MKLVKQGFAAMDINSPVKTITVTPSGSAVGAVVQLGVGDNGKMVEFSIGEFAEFAEAVALVMAELRPHDSVGGPAEAAAYTDRDGSTWERTSRNLYRCDDIDGERGLDEIEQRWGPLRRIG